MKQQKNNLVDKKQKQKSQQSDMNLQRKTSRISKCSTSYKQLKKMI